MYDVGRYKCDVGRYNYCADRYKYDLCRCNNVVGRYKNVIGRYKNQSLHALPNIKYPKTEPRGTPQIIITIFENTLSICTR